MKHSSAWPQAETRALELVACREPFLLPYKNIRYAAFSVSSSYS